MQLYANPQNPNHAKNNETFLRIVKEFPILKFHQPSPEKAPWHWQAKVAGDDPQLLNFWPHNLKGQRDGFKSVEGEDALIGIIHGAIADAALEPFDLIED